MPNEMLINIIQFYAGNSEDLFEFSLLNKFSRKLIIKSKVICKYIIFYPDLLFLNTNKYVFTYPIIDKNTVHPYVNTLIIQNNNDAEDNNENKYKIIKEKDLESKQEKYMNHILFPKKIEINKIDIDLKKNLLYGLSLKRLFSIVIDGLSPENDFEIIYPKNILPNINEIDFTSSAIELISKKLENDYNFNSIISLSLEVDNPEIIKGILQLIDYNLEDLQKFFQFKLSFGKNYIVDYNNKNLTENYSSI